MSAESTQSQILAALDEADPVRAVDEPIWAWEMVPALVQLHPEWTQEIGEFILEHYLEEEL